MCVELADTFEKKAVDLKRLRFGFPVSILSLRRRLFIISDGGLELV